MTRMIAYRLVQLLLKAAVEVFFRTIHVVGTEHVPAEGGRPVLFVGNHPNSLIDPVLIVATGGRIVHFAAKDKLFAFPLGLVLRALGAVPIARKMDHGDDPKRDNSSAFDAMYKVLAEGRSVGIFPEGLSHDRSQLQRMRSGAARVALDMALRHPEADLAVVPCGLTYVHRKRFRSRVLVQYGPPLEIGGDEVAHWQEDSVQAARALTERIEGALRGLTVNAQDWDTLRVLDGCRRLYQPPRIPLEHRVELARRFCEVYETVQDEPDVKDAFTRIARFLDDLDDAGLSDRDLVSELGGQHLAARAASNLARLCVWAPLALPGAPIHVPVLALVHWAGVRFAPRKDVIGTSRLMMGLLAALAAYVLLPVAAGLWWGLPAGLVAAVLLPLSGYATVRVLERGVSLSRLLRTAWSALQLGRTLSVLRAEREALEALVIDIVQRRLPEDMEPLFPQRLQDAPRT